MIIVTKTGCMVVVSFVTFAAINREGVLSETSVYRLDIDASKSSHLTDRTLQSFCQHLSEYFEESVNLEYTSGFGDKITTARIEVVGVTDFYNARVVMELATKAFNL